VNLKIGIGKGKDVAARQSGAGIARGGDRTFAGLGHDAPGSASNRRRIVGRAIIGDNEFDSVRPATIGLARCLR
jgi:hypothetical protein